MFAEGYSCVSYMKHQDETAVPGRGMASCGTVLRRSRRAAKTVLIEDGVYMEVDI